MKLIWDEIKRQWVLRKRGIDFAVLDRLFKGSTIDDYDADHSQDEERWWSLGMLDGDVILVVYTEKGDTIRVITARPATREETQLYYEQFFGEPI